VDLAARDSDDDSPASQSRDTPAARAAGPYRGVMEPLGPKIAEGRDSEIFEHGPGRVLRRARDGRSLVREAEVMRHVRANDYPAPGVFDAGEGWVVMERVEGGDMLAAMRMSSPTGSAGTWSCEAR